MQTRIKKISDIATLFPKEQKEINTLVEESLKDANARIERIVQLKENQYTFENTAKAMDNLFSLSDIAIVSHILSVIEMLNPDEALRNAAHKGILTLQAFSIDNISNNIKLYDTLKKYWHGNAKKEDLTDEQIYFITETVDEFKRSGLDLSEEKREQVKQLYKELAALELEFESNIAKDSSSVEVSKAELAGLNESYIDSLKKTDTDTYILGVDYPTYFQVMDNCKVEATRKKLYLAFNNRAYPKNEKILKEIIAKRDELAKILGFASYAHLDIDDQMAKTPQTVETFLSELIKKADIKEQKEFDMLVSDLPESATLTESGKIKAWDYRYITNTYKKKHFDLDENVIAQYFPANHTIEQLFKIYETFMALRFKPVEIPGLWSDEVKSVAVYKQENNRLLGYLLLDLYPRPNKFSHACQSTIIPAVKGHGPSLSVVVANFPKPVNNTDSLLKFNDVETFFHELGHALHAILGITDIASFAGTHVKTDFVEMPSQMLEQWLSDEEMLKKISRHHKTGEPLPQTLIDTILSLKQFTTGAFLQRQCYLSLLDLAYFKEGKEKDPKKIYTQLSKALRKNSHYDPDDNMFASFGHLCGYGAKYYSYMWAKVFALDLFNEIKKHGLLNPAIGQKYIREIIEKGGSKDPNQLLKKFLGRAPNQNAFCQYMGLE